MSDPKFEIIYIEPDTEELDPTLFDTKPLDTPTLDEQMRAIAAFGKRFIDDASNAKGDNDDAG
jgi:hypothetical protein